MKFTSLNLKEWIIKVLNDKHIYETTDIQSQAFSSKNRDKSLIITSKTGSGKTLCFLINVLNKIDLDRKEVQTLIVVPTKELARQIYGLFVEFTKYQNNLKVKLLGKDQNKTSVVSPQVIISTPNKALEFVKTNNIKNSIKFFVLDEVDMLFDFGFYNTINEVFKQIKHPKLIKYATSATLHESLANQLKLQQLSQLLILFE